VADRADNANVLVRPPLAWAVAAAVGLVLGWFWPWPILPATPMGVWLGAAAVALGLGLFVWAVFTMTRGGSNVPTSRPTITIVEAGPYRLTRNPIYLGMTLALLGMALALDSLWLLLTAALFVVVIRYGVIAREEAYLAGKFGDVYRRYRARVRRWL
jgi:protein-S-isoprenylcysteine O-methyltransferase Ste14